MDQKACCFKSIFTILSALGGLSFIAILQVKRSLNSSRKQPRIRRYKPSIVFQHRMPVVCQGRNGRTDLPHEEAPKRVTSNGQQVNQIKDKNRSTDLLIKKRATSNGQQVNQMKALKIHLPQEIIADILSWLPVQSILRFKCVSKLWQTSISEPFFSVKHFNRSQNNDNSMKFLINQGLQKGCTSFYMLSLTDGDARELGCPSNFKTCLGRSCCNIIRGCYGGLALLQCKRCYQLLLWNPYTRESVLLHSPVGIPSCRYGLAYDSTSGDYKILMVDNSQTLGPVVASTMILALKSGSWRIIDEHCLGLSNIVEGMESLAFLNGSFHWVGMDISQNYFVVSFCISNELYDKMILPKEYTAYSQLRHGVSVFDGHLCAYNSFGTHVPEPHTFKLWIMKVYGDASSWTLLLTVQDSQLVKALPKCRLANGELLLYYSDGKCQFRTVEGPFALWPIIGPFILQGFAITESLISPKLLYAKY